MRKEFTFDFLKQTKMKKIKRILLVEDNRDDQYFFVHALDKIENARMFGLANNGKEAMDKLLNSDSLPDLIFSDVNMPMMDGVECLTEIIKNPQTRNIPVVFLSTDIQKVEVVRQLGAKAFIKKTCFGKGLKEQLEEIINLDFVTDTYIAEQTFQRALSRF